MNTLTVNGAITIEPEMTLTQINGEYISAKINGTEYDLIKRRATLKFGDRVKFDGGGDYIFVRYHAYDVNLCLLVDPDQGEQEYHISRVTPV